MTGFNERLARWAALLPPLAVVLLYLPARHHGLVWDDELFLGPRAPEPLAQALWDALAQPFELSANFYRPAAMLSFLLDRGLADGAPWALHLHNALLHAASALLVTVVSRRLLPDGAGTAGTGRLAPWLPALAGLAYAAHPALVEAVAFVSGRFDLLLAFFL
ncbi:MAG: hypothetical protein JXR77_01375, partial [Lentisphaeria bacterium]|nr:hypothetical protein [Lentisphaeria bacterium]